MSFFPIALWIDRDNTCNACMDSVLVNHENSFIVQGIFLQHRDHGFELPIQWFLIESARYGTLPVTLLRVCADNLADVVDHFLFEIDLNIYRTLHLWKKESLRNKYIPTQWFHSSYEILNWNAKYANNFFNNI